MNIRANNFLGVSVEVRRRAFTLVEVMVAVGILALVSIGIYGTINVAQRSLRQTRCHAEAEMIAMDKLWFTSNNSTYAQLQGWTTTTETVASSSFLFKYGGTIRTSATQNVDADGLPYVQLTARVDWKMTNTGEFESMFVDHYPVTR